jgi:TRAP transporter TAXI family solute receptor
MKKHRLVAFASLIALNTGSSGVFADEPCTVTIANNLDIHIPCGIYESASGDKKKLWADLKYSGKDATGKMSWKLDGYEFVSSKAGKICTSPTAGTYHKYAGGVIEAAKDTLGLELEKVSTVGTVANAKGIASGRCDMAFVQADIFVQTEADPDLKLFTANKGSVAALYQEQVHIVVNRNSGITEIADLAGKKVNVDDKNSGTFVTANKILTAYHKLSPSPVYSHKRFPDALADVISGELDALFIVIDAPFSLLAELPSDANVTLIPATIPAYTTEYSVGTIPATAYPWLDSDITNNLTVWSLLTIGSSVDRSKLGAFLDKIYANKDTYASKYHEKWSLLEKSSSIEVLKTSPTSGWSGEAAHYYAGVSMPTGEPEPYFCTAPKLAEGSTTYTKVALDLIPIVESTLGLSLTERNTAGSIENLNKLYAGECAMAIIQDDAGGYAAAIDGGSQNIAGEMLKVQFVRAIMPLYAEQAQLIVNENSGIGSSADIAGKKFSMGPDTSGIYMTASTMLLINGLSEADVTPSYDPPEDALLKVISGEYDAMFMTDRAPTPFLAAAAADAPIEIVQIRGPDIYVKANFPASHYAWQDNDVPDSPDIMATIFVSPNLDLDADRVAKFIEAVYNIPADGSTNSTTWDQTTVEQGANHFKLPTYLYHWGAGKYFSDQMFLKGL